MPNYQSLNSVASDLQQNYTHGHHMATMGGAVHPSVFICLLPTVAGVLAFPTPTTFLAATVTVYCCTWELVTLNVC